MEAPSGDPQPVRARSGAAAEASQLPPLAVPEALDAHRRPAARLREPPAEQRSPAEAARPGARARARASAAGQPGTLKAGLKPNCGGKRSAIRRLALSPDLWVSVDVIAGAEAGRVSLSSSAKWGS